MHCYLERRKGSPNWYVHQYDAATGQVRRVSTGTPDRLRAEQVLAQHIIKLPHQIANDVTLVHIMLRYWEHHGQRVFSTNAVKRVMGLIVEHEPETRLYEWGIPQQKAFAAKIGRKPGTQRRYMGQIRAAVQWSFDNGEIPTMPAILRVEAQDGSGVRPFTTEELGSLLASATREHERRFLLLCLATGTRPRAALAIQWNGISEGVADFNQLGRRRTKKRYALAPLAPLASAYLEANRGIGPVIQWKGKQLATHKMTFRRIAQRAGVEGTAYGIRKAVAIWLRKDGVPEWDIKGLLGHSVGGVTERYAHYRPEYMRAAADSVERLLRAICPGWLASYLPVQAEEKAKLLINGGPYPIRTDDQFLKRGLVDMDFQGLKGSNDD